MEDRLKITKRRRRRMKIVGVGWRSPLSSQTPTPLPDPSLRRLSAHFCPPDLYPGSSRLQWTRCMALMFKVLFDVVIVFVLFVFV